MEVCILAVTSTNRKRHCDSFKTSFSQLEKHNLSDSLVAMKRFDGNNQGQTVQQDTSHRCTKCHMPLCKSDRGSVARGRSSDCLQQHLTSSDHDLGCCLKHLKGKCFPKTKTVSTMQAVSESATV